MDNKNIALVVTSLKSGGMERNASILANHFAKEGHNVYICFLYSTTCFFELNKDIHLVDLSTNKNKLISFSIWKKKLKTFFLDNKINTVISFGDRTGILVAKAKNKDMNHICRAINTKRRFGNKFLLRLNAKNIDHFVFQTKAQMSLYPNNIKSKGVNISNPFVIYDINQNIEGINSKRFITVASFKLKQKRQDVMIKAFKLFSLNHPDYVFEMFGSYNKKEKNKIDKLIKKERLEDKVILMGENKNIKEAIIPSRAFICSSTHEGMPNALIEALSYGIPAISSLWRGSKEIIENNVNGLLFNINDINSLANNMSLIADNDNLFKKLSSNSYNYIIKDYEYSKILKKWENII